MQKMPKNHATRTGQQSPSVQSQGWQLHCHVLYNYINSIYYINCIYSNILHWVLFPLQVPLLVHILVWDPTSSHPAVHANLYCVPTRGLSGDSRAVPLRGTCSSPQPPDRWRIDRCMGGGDKGTMSG